MKHLRRNLSPASVTTLTTVMNVPACILRMPFLGSSEDGGNPAWRIWNSQPWSFAEEWEVPDCPGCAVLHDARQESP